MIDIRIAIGPLLIETVVAERSPETYEYIHYLLTMRWGKREYIRIRRVEEAL